MAVVKYPTLKHAPIILAILEIRFKYTGVKKIEDLTRLNPRVSNEYPTFNTAAKRDVQVQELGGGAAKATVGDAAVEDFVYISADKQRNYKITLDRFNYNLNINYKDWEDFVNECRRVWDIYINNFFKNDITITGISIRFINKITINEKVNSPLDVFNVSITATEDVIPEMVNNYLIRYVIPYPENTSANVMQSLQQMEEDLFPFVFDIDVIKNQEIEMNSLWEQFDRLRNIKNDIFFKTLTQATINRYL